MKKFLVLAITVAALAWSVPASAADPILFDPTGADPGGSLVVTTFDWKPGNSLLIEDTDAQGNLTGTGTVYFQANLGVVTNAGGTTVFTSGTDVNFPGEYFTAVAGYRVNIIPTGPNTNTFTLTDLAGPTNFFNIYHNTVEASNLSGICFVCNDDLLGDPILSASATAADAALFGSFFAIGPAAPSALDAERRQ